MSVAVHLGYCCHSDGGLGIAVGDDVSAVGFAVVALVVVVVAVAAVDGFPHEVVCCGVDRSHLPSI